MQKQLRIFHIKSFHGSLQSLVKIIVYKFYKLFDAYYRLILMKFLYKFFI